MTPGCTGVWLLFMSGLVVARPSAFDFYKYLRRDSAEDQFETEILNRMLNDTEQNDYPTSEKAML